MNRYDPLAVGGTVLAGNSDNNANNRCNGSEDDDVKTTVRKKDSSFELNVIEKKRKGVDARKDDASPNLTGKQKLVTEVMSDDDGLVVAKHYTDTSSSKKQKSRWGPRLMKTISSTVKDMSISLDSKSLEKQINEAGKIESYDNNSCSSSSIPSSDSSQCSSSCGASAEYSKKNLDQCDIKCSNNEDSLKKNNSESLTSSLRVIAPEQHPVSIGTEAHLKSLGVTSEGIDDFDYFHNYNENEEENDKNAISSNETKPNQRLDAEHQAAIRASQLPIRETAKLWKLAPFLVKNLETNGYRNFFPIQALVIPDVIASERHCHRIRNRDVCVSAPTGSGKTLAFVIPILNSLSQRRVRRLRALVVLPNRDLAVQVHDVFKHYSRGSDLTIGLAIGQTDYRKEQRSLLIDSQHIDDEESPILKTKYSKEKKYMWLDDDNDLAMLQYALNPYCGYRALRALHPSQLSSDINNLSTKSNRQAITTMTTEGRFKLYNKSINSGGRSAVDILVCTPGRLIAHLDNTPGFTLQHLRFLVLDEADRLVSQHYQNWIRRVHRATFSGPKNIRQCSEIRRKRYDQNIEEGVVVDPVTWRRSGTSDEGCMGDDWKTTSLELDPMFCHSVQLRKWLFSATLTSDPQKLATLGLVNPKRYDAHQLLQPNQSNNPEMTGASRSLPPRFYSLPQSLSEFQIECRTAEQKIPVLLSLLLDREEQHDSDDGGIAVVFTSSIDSTHRLTRILQLVWCGRGCGSTSSICEFSSALDQKQRFDLVRRCRRETDNNNALSSSTSAGRIRVVVCSDSMSRGMDLPSVTTVINYDVPSHAKTYVHRCGRTARAGKKGRAITLLKKGQVGQFANIHRLVEACTDGSVSGAIVQPMSVRNELMMEILPLYRRCVQVLRKVVDAEKNDNLCPMDPLNDSDWKQQLSTD